MIRIKLPMSLCCVTLLLPAIAMSQDNQKMGMGANATFAGAYFLEFDASLLAGQLPGTFFLPGITTLHADGTVLALDGTDEGLAGAPGFSINSASMGNWVQVGPRSIEAKSLYLSYFRTQTFNLPGVLEALTRLTVVLEFDPGLKTGSGFVCQQNKTVTPAIYNPDFDNPLEQLPDIACDETFPVRIPFTFERIR